MESFYFWTTFAVFAALGLAVGSFLNVVVYRLPRGMNLAKPASHCTSCGRKLAWRDNIPVFSYLFLRGKCRYCGAPVSPRYIVVETANCALWCIAVPAFYPQGVIYTASCALSLSVLLAMAFIDEENMFIPDSLQIALALCALAALFSDPVAGWEEKLLGAALSGGFFLFFYLLSFPLFGREGLGFGDVKLMACTGLLLGWKKAIVAVLFGVLYALAAVGAKKAFFRGARSLYGGAEEFAFAPYLVTGVIFALFAGGAVVNGYLSLFA